MNVYLFGKVDLPCCCIWGLTKTASDYIVKIASCAEEAIKDNFFMDDYLDSFHTVQKAIKVSNNVTNALSEGGFRLTKWVTNDQQILKALSSQEVSSKLINLYFDDISIERALGILYAAVAYFRYNERSDTRCSFIMSKSRLAQIKEKTLTVPKLELQAAVVACRMKNVILDEVRFRIKSVHC